MPASPKTPAEPSARNELIKYIAKESTGNQEKARQVLDVVLAGIVKSLKEGNTLRFLGFGSFSVQNIAARTGRNPRTGASIEIAANKRAVFKAGKDMKDALNPGRKQKKKTAKKKS